MGGTSRRALVVGAGGALGPLALAGAAAALPAAGAGRQVPFLVTYVAGTGHHADPKAVARLRPGEAVVLRREPENGYDARAVSVWTGQGEKLGYVPRIDNQALANLIDAGLLAVARVQAISPGGVRPEFRLEVHLTLGA